MIDFGVVYDKLAQFETADDIADFFCIEGVRGYKGVSYACPIATWMNQTTGKSTSVSGASVRDVYGDMSTYLQREKVRVHPN